MAGKEAAAAVAGAAGGSLLTYALTRAREVRAAPPEGVDPELWNMLLNLVDAVALQSEGLGRLTTSVDNLVRTMGGVPVSAEDPFENANRFVTGQIICPILNQAFQLPSFPIPKDKQLAVKALPGNVTWMYVGVTRADSQNLLVAYILVPNEGIGLTIKNSNRVFVMATTINDGVTFIVEQN